MFAQTLPKHAKTKDRGQDSALCLHDRQGLVLGTLPMQFFLSPFSLLVSFKSVKMRVASAKVVFVGVAILGSILAYEGERTSRASFRSKVKAGQVGWNITLLGRAQTGQSGVNCLTFILGCIRRCRLKRLNLALKMF